MQPQGPELTQEIPGDPAVGYDLHGQIVTLSKALSDPIRVRMMQLMAQGREAMGLPSIRTLNVPGPDDIAGICVCEFQEAFDLGQSKVSYHLRILREAGLVTEESRGKWSFYSLNRRALRNLADMVLNHFAL